MLKSIYLSLALIGAPLTMAAVTVQPAYAESDEIYTSIRDNYAAGSYDVVSFHLGNPVKGDRKITTEWKGATWRFASEGNRDTFLEEPEKYAPAYGGYCAWAIANNKLAKGSPKHWSIVDDVLYLNFNKNIKNKWLRDTDGFIEKADTRWPQILED